MVKLAPSTNHAHTFRMDGDGSEVRRVRNLRVKAFVIADRWVDRIARVVQTVHEGFWLGSLNADELNAVTARHFDQSQFYASGEHNQSGLFEWEKNSLNQYFPPRCRVLVAGAGGGREVVALRQAGFDAEGFECSLPLVQASQKVFEKIGESNHVVHCAADRVPDGTPTYDALLIGWTAYTHIPTKERRSLFLKALRQRVYPGAPLVISFFARTSPPKDEALVYWTARLCQSVLRGKGRLEEGDRISFARYVHWFTKDELTEELQAVGFRVAQYVQKPDFGYAIGIAV